MNYKLGSNSRLEMTSPSEANFDEAALEAELEALHMSRCVLFTNLLYQKLGQAQLGHVDEVLDSRKYLAMIVTPTKMHTF